jgi:S-formylglutathione hydrolase
MPVHMVGPMLTNIQRLRGIFIEYGAQENFAHIPAGAQRLSSELSQAGVPHTLEVFEGDHINHLVERLSDHMLPWMSRQLTSSK